MRIAVLIFTALTLFGQPTAESEVSAAVQRLFNAMAIHDAAGVRASFLPGATLTAVRNEGKPISSNSEEFAIRIGSAKEVLLERMWSPQVLIHGSIAVLWAPYDFHRDGKFSHCGVDSVSLAKSEGTWKIAFISYTTEMANCPESPFGKP